MENRNITLRVEEIADREEKINAEYEDLNERALAEGKSPFDFWPEFKRIDDKRARLLELKENALLINEGI